MSVTKTEAIKNFLNLKAQPDLAALYHFGMECQVMAAPDGGEIVQSEYRGKKWTGWTDGQTTWKHIRIPWKANSEPEFQDSKMTWDLLEHCEAIGMTGWDWQKRVSKWVAYDFDSIVGHSEKHLAKITDAEMARVKEEACAIPWVEVRKSTSGRGLHLYVYLDDIPTANHNEHAALGRAILGNLSMLTGFPFDAKVDICGGNMWVWGRGAEGTDGFTLIKKAEGKLPKAPDNWKNHLRVVKGSRFVSDPTTMTAEKLAASENNVDLHPDHIALFKYLHDNKLMCSWDQDLQLLSTHTCHLQAAQEELGFVGNFQTDSPGNNLHEQNCFCYPRRS